MSIMVTLRTVVDRLRRSPSALHAASGTGSLRHWQESFSSRVDPARRRPFNLRLWFAVCGLGTIILLCAGTANWLAMFMTNSILEREGKLSQEFLESITAVNGPETFRDTGNDQSPPSPQLIDLANHLLNLPGIQRINVHSVNRRILWSNEPQLIDRVFKTNAELDRAFSGEVVTEVSSLEGDIKEEHIALGSAGSLIESYVPIRSNIGRGPIVGVVEFYRFPYSLETTLLNGQRTIWLGALVASVVMFLSLYWIVQRGARVIEGQQQSLVRLEAAAAVGEMASAVAHSLRNPMASIRSSAELWQLLEPERGREVTSEVIAEVDRMDRHVNELLAYARSDARQLAAIDPMQVVDAILQKQSRSARRLGVTIAVVNSGAEGLLVMAEAMMLEQALTSLVTNAIEAMPEGGALTISIAAGGGRGRAEIRIRDTGHGIPPDMIDRVTESYFTTKTRGLGLGLVLAKGIVERFGGVLTIRSGTPNGTEAIVNLQAAP